MRRITAITIFIAVIMLCLPGSIVKAERQIVSISTTNMEPAIQKGDNVLCVPYGEYMPIYRDDLQSVLTMDSEPKRLDIIIFKYTDNDEYSLGRIIGLGGETVDIVDGIVYINGEINEECNECTLEEMRGSYGSYDVPEDCYFILGDNRNNSKDSRYQYDPYVQKSDILGEVIADLTTKETFISFDLKIIVISEKGEVYSFPIND